MFSLKKEERKALDDRPSILAPRLKLAVRVGAVIPVLALGALLWHSMLAHPDLRVGQPRSAMAVKRETESRKPERQDSKSATPQRTNRFTIKKFGSLPTDFPGTSERRMQCEVEFLNDGEGWMSWGSGVWRTSDAGQSWRLIYDGSPDSIREFQFVSSEIGWILSGERLYKTTDSGASWALCSQPIQSNNGGDLLSFRFLEGGKDGWVAGGVLRKATGEDFPPARYATAEGNHGFRGVVYRTIDFGRTWQKQQMKSDWGYIGKLATIDPEHAWATGSAGTFFLNGARWERPGSRAIVNGRILVNSLDVAVGLPSWEPSNLFFLNTRLGWLSNSNGYLGRTMDGGRSWKDIFRLPERDEFGLRVFFTDIYFSDANRGIGVDNKGRLYVTEDGGAMWSKQDIGFAVLAMTFESPKRGWIVSTAGLFRIDGDVQ